MAACLSGSFGGTRTSFQRFSDSKLFHGWIHAFTPSNLVVRASTDHLIQKGERFIFHAFSTTANARFVADFQAVDGLEQIHSRTVSLSEQQATSVIEVSEASYAFNIVSQLEYTPPTEEARHLASGWMVRIEDEAGAKTSAFLSDVSGSGAGILSASPYKKGESLCIQLEALSRTITIEAEVRYSVKSKVAPDMFKSGLKLSEFGRLEGAVWRNFLKVA